MTATERLRELLDERKKQHMDTMSHDGSIITRWGITYGDGAPCVISFKAEFTELENGRNQLVVWDTTPEQAIEATLGRGTCRDTSKYINYFTCSECGEEMDFVTEHGGPHYCPNCGKEVVNDA